jgi:intracellular sulfur oxidation DsrE/DsrF family protein
MMENRENKRDPQMGDANSLLIAGTSAGVIGAAGTLITGAVCPLCVVAAPALLSMGLFKRIRLRRGQEELTQGAFDKRSFWYWAAVAAFVVGALVLAAPSGWAQEAKVHRIVFELTSDTEEQWQAALNNVENVQKAFGRERTQIEVITHGKGLALLKKTTPLKDRVATIAKTGARFLACENTMKRQQVEKEDLLPEAQTVDSGVAEVVRKQEAGWSYVKSGW